MCCFSRPVDRVANTNIFARPAKDGRQYLVYSMTLSAKEDLAMILPLPVPKNPPEDAVRFISLKEYPGFFGDLKNGFPEPPSPKVDSRSRPPTLGQAPPLKVVEVGSFEASFVPAIKDFDRLDERFRLSGDVWGKLPQYKDAGFAVFKLKPGTKTVHPMAFEFPRANPAELFFPTVHIHDGKVHPRAGFDHALYCQASGYSELGTAWRESPQPAGMFMMVSKAQGLLDPEGHCYRRELRGQLKNADVVLA